MKIDISIYQYNREHFIQEYLENAHIDVAQIKVHKHWGRYWRNKQSLNRWWKKSLSPEN